MKFKVNIKFEEHYSKVVEAESQEEANRIAKALLAETNSPALPALDYYDGNPDYRHGHEDLTLESVEPVEIIKDFKLLNYRKYSQNQMISIEEDGRGAIALVGSEKNVLQVIRDEYCGIPAKILSTEFRKHNDELVISVELTEDDGETSVREYELKTLAYYP